MKNLWNKFPHFLKKPGALISIAWLIFLIFGSLLGKYWLPYDPTKASAGHELELPTWAHLMGTDDLGRDIFSRLFSSGALSIYASAWTLGVAFLLGLPLALIAAEKRGRVENLISRFADIVFALPATVMLLALIGTVGSKTEPVMIFFGFLIAPAIYRVLVGQTIAVRQRLYVDAARLNGLNSLQINVRHVLPALYRFLAVQVAMLFSVTLLMQAGLAFLGLGPQEPQASWGAMIGQGNLHIYDFPWMMVPAGLILVVTVLAANHVADVIGGGDPALAKPMTILIRSVARKVPPASSLEERPADPAALLEIRDLHVRVAGAHELVTGVSLKVMPGKVLGIVGESGCGKTMTALSVIGVLPKGVEIASGSVFLNGRDIAGWSEKQLNTVRGSEIAYISQEPMVALDPMFSVANQLTTQIVRLRKVSKKQAGKIALDVMNKVGIPSPERVLKSYPHQLSGGMAQRVAIALALTGQPKLLIADEPTTALDVTIQAEILELLRSIVVQFNTGIVIVTHNLGVVADIADEVAVMYAGEVVESGSVSNVLNQPAHPYTAALLGADPHVPANAARPDRLASIPGNVPAPATWTNSCRFAARCDFATEICKQPLVQSKAHVGGTVKCLRHDQIKLELQHK
jgi:peptide/nickel transport system permease protein